MAIISGLSLKETVEIFRVCSLIRQTELEISKKYTENKMRCPVHLSIGQESCAVGICENLNQKDIENYLQNNITGKCFLEIGCGGGQWSKYIYNLQKFDKLYCIDVLSEEHNKFWDYVGNEKKDKIKYFQVNDFLLDFIPTKIFIRITSMLFEIS